mmetsp:Transcript_70731/g.133572  ORF Transcript_70731/g.133572 Transcript_70731/m.133572 type:complete len:592 (-) Transcript_70731:132-1907(-)
MATSIEFSCWEEWTGSEVAFFISTFCELPQYADAIGQNLTGAALKRLNAANMLHKGLARAGVCDFDHQRQIAAAVVRLETLTPEELDQELNTHLEGQGLLRFRKKPRIPAPPARPAGKGRPHGCFIELHLLDLEALSKPRVASPTTARMQRPSSAGGDISSRERYTPRPWAVATAPDPTSPEPPRGCTDPDSSRVSLRLRRNLASTLSEYEAMREAPSPIYGTMYVEKAEAARGNSAGGRLNGEPLGTASSADEVVGMDPASPSSRVASSAQDTPLRMQSAPSDGGWAAFDSAFDSSPKKDSTNKGSALLRDTLNVSSSSKGAFVLGDQAMLGSELNKGDAASGGVRGIQQIQAQRSQKKGDSNADKIYTESKMTTLDTMHKVLGPDAQADESVLQALSCDRPQSNRTHKQEGNYQSGSKSAANVGRKSAEGESMPRVSSFKKLTPAEDASLEEQAKAATTLQCRVRQRQAMRETELRRHEVKLKQRKTLLQKSEEEAAIKIQAMHRGNQVRKAQEATSARLHASTTKRRSPSKQPEESPLGKEEEKAATKIQAIHRGKKTRRDVAQKVAEKQAATRIQAIHRGNKVRKGA